MSERWCDRECEVWAALGRASYTADYEQARRASAERLLKQTQSRNLALRERVAALEQALRAAGERDEPAGGDPGCLPSEEER